MVRNKDDLPYCRCVLGEAYCSYSVLTLPSFCVNNWSSIGLIWRVICASSKIRTRDHRTIRQDSYPLDHDASTWFIGIILWYDHIFTNGDDRWKGYQVRTWSSYASWSLFCGRFVDIQSFRCIFRIRDGNDISQFGRTEVKETQGYATESLQIFTILLVTPTQINYHGVYHSIVWHHPTNRTSTPELNKVWFSR